MIELRSISIRQGSFSLDGLNLRVPERAYAVLMGRTGSGKSTLLEIICGLRTPSAGSVFLHGREVTDLQPAERNVAYVPQDRALFPHMTVGQQMAFGLHLRHWRREEVLRRVNDLAERLHISALLNRSVSGLSGGEAQRVALGRALAPHPKILCLDEPLGAVDEDTRDGLLLLLREMHQAEGTTVLHVTHSSSEAAALADLRLRLNDDGTITQEISHAER